MNWKHEIERGAFWMIAGAALFAWITRPEPVDRKPPEIGRDTFQASRWQKEQKELRLEVARLSAQQARGLVEKYGEALRTAVGRSRLTAHPTASPGLGTILPGSGTAFPRSEPAREWTLEDVAAGLESGEIAALAEKRFGPGPRGDKIDVFAFLPCEGCGVEMVGRWDDPPRLASARWSVEKRRFLEAGPAYTESGPGAVIVLGLDGIRIRRVTFGLRAGALVAQDPAVWVAAVGRLDWD